MAAGGVAGTGLVWVSDLHRAGIGPDQVAAWYAAQAETCTARAAALADVDPDAAAEASARADLAAWNAHVYAAHAKRHPSTPARPAPAAAVAPAPGPDLFTTEDTMHDHCTTTAPASLLDAALVAAARGWHVFPLRLGDKRPAVSGWEQRATTDADRIRRCWATGAFNVGIATGPSDLFVVDLDVPKPGTAPPIEWQLPGVATGEDVLAVLAERAGAPLPYDTYTVATPSGGRHLYFQHPDGPELRNTAKRLGWLIDTRAHGGYVVAAGSVLDGRPYTVALEHPVELLPTWLVQPLVPNVAGPVERPKIVVSVDRGDRRAAYLASAIRHEADLVANAPTGRRNHVLFTAAVALGQLVAGGALSADMVTEALDQAANDAGLGSVEARHTIASGLRTGARNPRAVAA
ncbi:bifunctional DNA primase/polymerase [Cryptosporangium japonicum]|uniref:DNA primase/polymerase bifunctional N-terminal domain-containing protein n=1 Tax=Cryptosporangium japonicum TaxID=80872 RepID=A0ABP3EAX7_9ACTN